MHCSKGITSLVAFTAVAGMSVLAGCGSSAHHPAPERADVHAGPIHLHWVNFQGEQVPVGDQGPKHIDGPIAAGYDASPAGAALAAIESTIRMSIADDKQWVQVGQQLLAAGAGRDRWATVRIQVSISEPVPTDAAPHVLGYAVTDYTATKADVAVYTRQTDGSLTRNVTAVVRHEDTWLLDLPANPDGPPITAVTHTPPDMVHLPATTKEPTR